VAAALFPMAGRPDLSTICGAVFTVLMGFVLLFGCYMSASTFGEAWMIGIGRITRQSHPLVYWTILGIPMSVGLLVSLIGICWCYRMIRG